MSFSLQSNLIKGDKNLSLTYIFQSIFLFLFFMDLHIFKYSSTMPIRTTLKIYSQVESAKPGQIWMLYWHSGTTWDHLWSWQEYEKKVSFQIDPRLSPILLNAKNCRSPKKSKMSTYFVSVLIFWIFVMNYARKKSKL